MLPGHHLSGTKILKRAKLWDAFLFSLCVKLWMPSSVTLGSLRWQLSKHIETSQFFGRASVSWTFSNDLIKAKTKEFLKRSNTLSNQKSCFSSLYTPLIESLCWKSITRHWIDMHQSLGINDISHRNIFLLKKNKNNGRVHKV